MSILPKGTSTQSASEEIFNAVLASGIVKQQPAKDPVELSNESQDEYNSIHSQGR